MQKNEKFFLQSFQKEPEMFILNIWQEAEVGLTTTRERFWEMLFGANWLINHHIRFFTLTKVGKEQYSLTLWLKKLMGDQTRKLHFIGLALPSQLKTNI